MDLIVKDEEYESIAQSVTAFAERAEYIFTSYINCMTKLGTTGFISGTTSDNIKAYVSSITPLKGDLNSIAECLSSECAKYIADLDEADDFVY